MAIGEKQIDDKDLVFTKFPKWVQDYIRKIQYERDAAVRTLNEFIDNQTPTNIYTEAHPCTGEASGPTHKINYIQGHGVTFKIGKEEISVRFTFDHPGLRISSGWRRLVFKPEASNCIEIVEEKP